MIIEQQASTPVATEKIPIESQKAIDASKSSTKNSNDKSQSCVIV